MLPILLLSFLSPTGASPPAHAEWVNRGVRFARIDAGGAARRDDHVYRVSLLPGGREAGRLVVTCDDLEIVGASFEPKLAVDGNAIVRAADDHLCR